MVLTVNTAVTKRQTSKLITTFAPPVNLANFCFKHQI